MFVVYYGGDHRNLMKCVPRYDTYKEAEICADIIRARGFPIVYVEDDSGVAVRLERSE